LLVKPTVPSCPKKKPSKFEKAVALRAKGWSLSLIAVELGVGKHTVERWLMSGKPKRVWRHEPDLTPRRDLAYVAGFYLGDGRGAGHENKVRFNLGGRFQLELVSRLVARILGMSPKPCSFDGMFYAVDYDSVMLSNFLNQPLVDLVKYLKGFEPDFLQGFFDAEGYASCRVDLEAKVIRGLMVGVANTNLDYLNWVRILLARLGIASSIHRTNRAGQVMTLRGRSWTRRYDVYHVLVTGEPQIRLFNKKVGFRNPSKADKLESLIRMMPMTTSDRFDWFTARYTRTGRRWLRSQS
jgi:hypothetical protein